MRQRTSRYLGATAFLVVLAGALAAPASSGAAPKDTTYGWGDFGQHGPQNPSVSTPTPVSGVPGTVTQVVATNAATYALTADGQVWAWGAGTLGELGNGASTNSFSTPVQVAFPAGVTITSLPAPMPYATAMAIDSTGHIWGWGDDSAGSLCLGNLDHLAAPTELPFTDVTAASGGGVHAIYVANGKTYACGRDSFGELGNGKFGKKQYETPVSVVGLPSAPVALFADYATSGALLANGSYYDWGDNATGQLGDGVLANSDVPVAVSLPAKPTSIFLGGNNFADGQTLAVLGNGKVVAWGNDADGQLCDGQVTNAVETPETLPYTWTSVTSGGTDSYAVDGSGNLYACGSDRNGELGNGVESTTVSDTPQKVLSGVTMISSTSHNVVAEAVAG